MRLQTILPYLAALTLLFTACKQETRQSHNDMPQPDRLPKDQRIGLLAKHETLMTADPVTGEVPKDKLYHVRKALQAQVATRSVQSRSWTPIGPTDVGGRTRAITVDMRDTTMSTIWVGSVSGGLWRCTDALTVPQWTRIDDWPGSPSISSIVQDPNDLETFYVSTGEGWFNADAYRGDGIYKSVDGGISWTLLEETANARFRYTQKMLFTQRGDLLACTRDRGIMRSQDGGLTWEDCLSNRTTTGASSRAADVEMAAGGTLYASMGIFSTDGVYKSEDDGDNWTFLEFPEVDPYERIEIALSPVDTSRVLVLLQDEDTRGCKYIMESTDAGDSWRQLNVPSAIGMDNFARNQAWYDLVAMYHPTDTSTIIIGGVDLIRSRDGGDSWQQLTNWREGTSPIHVHADQHFIVPVPGQPDAMLFGNDGGVWLSEDLRADDPDFRDLSQGYISTQYYACSLHPDPEVSYYMAGAQDNGTQAMTRDSLGPAEQVLGGDGAFNHIDEEDGDIRIGAFQNGNYVYTTDAWQNREFLFPPGTGFFINPTTYDTPSKTMYGSYSGGSYLYLEVLTGVVDSVSVPGLGSNRVSALKVDPSDSNVLYIGSESGTLLRLTNPKSQDHDLEVLRTGSGYLRAIDIDRGNRDRIVMCYSNFNTQSVYYSEDYGDTFENLELNLPNVPVRWVSFAPNTPQIIIAATEVGMWELDLSADVQEWLYVGDPIGAVRVDMITPRYQDGHVAVATYGRGMYTTDDYATAALGFASSVSQALEVSPEIEDCGAAALVQIPLGINQPADTAINIQVSVVGGSAVEGRDYALLTQDIQLPAQTQDTFIEVEVYSDRMGIGDRTVVLNLSTADLGVSISRHTLTIVEDDQSPSADVNAIQYFFAPDGTTTQAPFTGFWEDGRSQFVYSREQLSRIGVEPGTELTAMQLVVSDKQSSQPFEGFTVTMANISQNSTDIDFIEAEADVVYEGDYSTVLGFNRFDLTRPFAYDGEAILVSFCYDNQSFTSSDAIAAFMVDDVDAITARIAEEDGAIGCELQDVGDLGNFLPALFLESLGSIKLSTTTDLLASDVDPDIAAYYYASDSIVGSARVDSEGEAACISMQVIEDGSGLQACPTCQVDYSTRQVDVDHDSDQVIDYCLYFNMEVLDQIDIDLATIYHVETDSLLDAEVTIVDGVALACFASDLTGTYALAANIVSSTAEVTERPSVYDYLQCFDIQGRKVYQGSTMTDLPAGIYIVSYVVDGRPVYTEKVISTQ